MQFLAISIGLKSVISIVMALVYIGYTIFISRHMKKQSELRAGGILLYISNLVILFVFICLILWLFNYNYQTQLDTLWTNIVNGFSAKIGALIGSVITIFVAVLIIKIVTIVFQRAAQRDSFNKKRIKTVLKVMKSLIKYTVEIIALIVILALWGVNVMPALAGLGILGVVVGLGAQSLIKDFISGFFIIFEHHFDVGDIVEIDGFKGEVIDIGLKSTKVRNWKQDIRIYSNGNIGTIINYTLSPSMAVVDFGIAYGEDIQKTIDLLKQELPKFRETYPEIIEDPQVLGVIELANSSVNMRVIAKTEMEKHYAVERAIRQGIKELLDKNNIEIPFPQVVVHKSE